MGEKLVHLSLTLPALCQTRIICYCLVTCIYVAHFSKGVIITEKKHVHFLFNVEVGLFLFYEETGWIFWELHTKRKLCAVFLTFDFKCCFADGCCLG